MPWFPVDDAFHSHPKARKAGDEALGMWTRAGAYCMAYLTDGFVADWWVKEQPKGVVKARRLVAAELWRRGEKDGESGYWFHDWKPECTKAHVLDVREKARQRKAKSRESQEQSQEMSRVTVAEPDAGVLGPTQPNPTQSNNPLVNSGGGVTQATRERPPRPECSEHPENFDGPCRKCKRRREWDEHHAAQSEADELEQRRAAKATAAQIRRSCRQCDGDGWLLAADGTPVEPAIKCTHQGVSHA